MDFDDTPADAGFRAELRAWLAAEPPPRLPEDPDAAFEARRAWQRVMAEAGWAAPGWPAEHGGRGATTAQQIVYQEELALAGAPPIANTIGVWNIGPAIIASGTDEQARRWLPAMLTGDEIWCQGFSEPSAGSDLASLRTRAVRDGDRYVVDGRKIWISRGDRARWCFALCRTSDGARPHDGISALVIDMQARGVHVEPLPDITGATGFSEVSFDGVEVPVADRVGDEGAGWRVAMSALTHERIGTVTYGIQTRQMLEALLARDEMWPSDTVLARVRAQETASLWIETELLRLTALRAVTRVTRGEDPWPEVPIGKLLWSATAQHLAEVAVRALGSDGVRTGARAPDAGRWANEEVWSRMATIAAGTTEVQKNILAERALGLPR